MRKPALLLIVPLLALAGTVTETIVFDSRDIEITEYNGYYVIRFADFVTTREIGKPMMPEAVFNIAVPPTATVTGIKVTPLELEEIPGTYNVCPTQPAVPISATTRPEFVKPDEAAYASAESYPAAPVDWGWTGTKSGWRICGFALHPLTWVPATGRLTLSRKMQVEVSYRENDVGPTRITASQRGLFRRDVAGIVINPGDVDRFAPPERITDDPDVDYAIITSSSLAAGFDDLVEWRTKKGYAAAVFTTGWITTNYTGRDTQEKIRNFIIDYFENYGLKFVLLAGDNSVVPGRRCRSIIDDETGNIPADVYYADLQWSYDGNHNNIFGEMIGDTVDLFYDVYVGRASVDNATQVATFVNKVLAYEKTPTTDYLKKMLLPYVQLWTGYSGKIVSDTIAVRTPADWTDYLIQPASTTPMRNAINEGYHFSHVAAHGDAYGFYTQYGSPIYTTSTAGAQTNLSRPVIMNSIACISGNFEAGDCLAEVLMNNANGGAVAAIMNSRYGLGFQHSMGPSEKFDVKFYDFLFTEDSIEIGVTHARSKDYYAYSAQHQEAWRWCYWALNLFGDPEMPMWKGAPDTLHATHLGTIETGAQDFDVAVVTSGGAPIPDALVCAWKDGEVHATGKTNGSGEVTLTINPLTTGTMHVTATAKQMLPDENTVSVTPGAPQPFINYQHHFVDDGGNNQLDPGETANLYVTIKNIGNADATTVQGVLRTGSSHITMTDSTSDYGTVSAGDTARGDAFTVTAASATPPGSRVRFTLHLTSAEGTWDPEFELIVGTAPIPGAVIMDHDTGYCKLTVTCLGSIGFTDTPGDIGTGFSYPKTAASQLYYSSFLVGNSPAWLVDRFYGHPASGGVNTDFEIVDSLRSVVPAAAGDQHYRAVMNDARHTSSKDLKVTQQSYMSSNPGYDDFVVLIYDLKNEGASTLDDFYAGIITDFDLGADPRTNQAYSNEAKRYSYMRQNTSANPCVGVKILDPPSFANLTAIDHDRYVYPDSCMTDGQKYRILNGDISLRNSSRNYDWSVGVSVGSFSLPAGATQRVAFAFIGGTSVSDFEANADSAQSWYDNYIGLLEREGMTGVRNVEGISCTPNPFTRSVRVSYQLPTAGRVRIQIFDITGRSVATLVDDELPAGKVEAVWQPGKLANGVYLVRASRPGATITRKLMLLR